MTNSRQFVERSKNVLARRCLKYLRAGDENYEETLKLLEDLVPFDNYLLEKVGTSVQELKILRGKGALAKAENRLQAIRRGVDHVWYKTWVQKIREELGKAGKVLDKTITLAEIGSSEEELESLRIASAKFAAKQALNGLLKDGKREATWTFSAICEAIHTILGEVGLKLKDVGSSERELKTLGPAS